MRNVLLIATLLAVVAVPASAQPQWRIELSADQAMSSCVITGDGSGFLRVHMFLTGDVGATAVQFAAYVPECWPGATWLGDILADPNWLSIGNTQHQEYGLSIAFRGCAQLPVYLGSVNMIGAPAAACCEMAVAKPYGVNGWEGGNAVGNAVVCPADPGDASQYLAYGTEGGRVIVNSGPGCTCEKALATEASTWGRVKSLYR